MLELLKAMKGILPPLWLAAVSCESVEVGSGQWDSCILAGFALDLHAIQEEGSLVNGHIRPTDLPLHASVGRHAGHPPILDVVMGYLKPAGVYKYFLLFLGT